MKQNPSCQQFAERKTPAEALSESAVVPDWYPKNAESLL